MNTSPYTYKTPKYKLFSSKTTILDKGYYLSIYANYIQIQWMVRIIKNVKFSILLLRVNGKRKVITMGRMSSW